MMNFSKVKLSKRLSLFASYYKDQDIIWDIGCDHGHLGLSFINHHKSPLIYLVDPAKPVIEKLEKTISASDIPRVTLLHKSGQDLKLQDSNSNSIFIAGMGGLEIIDILKNILPQIGDKDQILISPHNKVLEVRGYLQNSGEWLRDESVMTEGGIWYPYFVLGSGGCICPDFGEGIFKTPTGKEYRHYLIGQLSKHRDSRSKEFLNFLKGN